ncbi:MAG: YceD family protein [Alphaproteobacteria bacterium]
MTAPAEPALPLDIVFNIERLGATPSHVVTRADVATCKAIAEYLGVERVENFHAELALRRWRKHGAVVEGDVGADIVQQCVVTLEPVHTHVSESVNARFLPETTARSGKNKDEEVWIDPLADDPPESFGGRDINLGALILEHLALGIDPYPRAPGAALPESARFLATGPEKRASPFQVLAKLRDKSDT